MINILHVASSVSRGSGVTNVIMNYYRHIDRKQCQFDFLIFGKMSNDYTNEIEELGGVIHIIPKPNVKNLSYYKKQLNQFFRKYGKKYDIIQLHEIYLNSIIFPIAKRNGIKVRIVHSHTTLYSDKKVNAIRNFIMFMPLKKTATHFFACGKQAGFFTYGKKYVESGKVYIMNNAIEVNKYFYNEDIRSRTRQALGIEDQEILIGNIGRFAPQKNHKFILQIFNQLCKKNQNFKLVLIGEGPDLESIQEMAKKYKIQSKVLFLGSRNDVPDLLQAMDIFILPSKFEGLPIVAVEAQAAGLPCILSDNITKEVEYGTVKYLSIKCVQEWCNTIEEITISTEGYRNISKDCLKQSGFDINVEADKLLFQYEKILNQ